MSGLAVGQGLPCSHGRGWSGSLSRARCRLSPSTLFLWTGTVLFVFKRVPPIRLSLTASSKLRPILADLHALA